MIYKVEKLNQDSYLLNESVKINKVEELNQNTKYEIEFNSNHITKQEAFILENEFESLFTHYSKNRIDNRE